MVRVIAFLSSLMLAVLCYALLPRRRLAADIVADQLIVYKGRRQLQLWAKGKLIKSYKIALGKQPIGAKSKEGDMCTPEGNYIIHDKNAKSSFYLNLGISYPNAQDKANAEVHGHTTGGAIKIHGLRNGNGWRGRFHRWQDWTAGCIAVTNIEMDELFNAVPINTPIVIYP